MTKLAEVEGIDVANTAKLEGAGVDSIEKLLEAGATKKGREALADKSKIGEKLILGWVNCADLMRIKGIRSEYSDLLEAAGVDSVPELAQRNATHLTAAMQELNEQKHLVRRIPTESEVTSWIAEAKKLPRIVTH
jgi:predicted RecB family nuclease